MILCSTFTDWDRCTKTVVVEHGIEESPHILHLIQIYVRSLRKHWGELNVYRRDALIDTDVIIPTVINIEATEPLPFYFDEFHAIPACRQGIKGGGILVYIKNTWLSDRIDMFFNHAEILVVNIHKAELSFTICAVYTA